jgi:hypothetical protein
MRARPESGTRFSFWRRPGSGWRTEPELPGVNRAPGFSEYPISPPEREAGTRLRALERAETPYPAGRTACGVIQGRQRRASTLHRTVGTPYRRASTSYEAVGTPYRRPSTSHEAIGTRYRRPGTPRPKTSARGRVPASRSCGEVVYRRAMGTVHPWEFTLRAPPTARMPKNEEWVPDPGRGPTAV